MSDPKSSADAQLREREDPDEHIRPIPALASLIALALVAFGVIYIFMSGPYTPPTLGDQRTLADLSGPRPAAPGATVDGKAVYAAQCAACHQATGQGLPGVFPPLAGSEWVTGEPRVLANILLHGVEGSIEVTGQTYQGSMPAFAQLSDAELAAVASHIRSDWGNQAEALDAELFAQERSAVERDTPFAGGDELKALLGGS